MLDGAQGPFRGHWPFVKGFPAEGSAYYGGCVPLLVSCMRWEKPPPQTASGLKDYFRVQFLFSPTGPKWYDMGAGAKGGMRAFL